MTPLLAALLRHFSTLRSLAARIDHTNLDINATEDDIRRLCDQARYWGFASVCVRPNWVDLAAGILRGSGVRVCTVISFHEGHHSISDKIAEARVAIARGAQDVDWVFGYENLIEYCGAPPMSVVHLEVAAIAELAREFPNVTFKVIVECCALGYSHKAWICELLARAMVISFIKTSTGFGKAAIEGGPTGATKEDVAMFGGIIAECGSLMQIKASGGIRDLGKLIAMADAGATRFGIGHKAAMEIMDAAVAAGLAA